MLSEAKHLTFQSKAREILRCAQDDEVVLLDSNRRPSPMNPAPPPRRIFLQSLALAGASRAVFGATGLPKLPTVDEELRRAAKAVELRLMFKGHPAAELTAGQKEFS